jgi:xanthine/uracil permease
VKFTYGLDERPPAGELLLFGMQWLAIAVPAIVIIGKVIGTLHFSDGGAQVIYLQKVAFVTALTLLVQVLWGHGLPLIVGPAAVLLVGIVAARGSSLPAIYTAIAVGGAVLAALGISGLFAPLQRLFTARVIAVVLLLIAFTLLPTILQLVTAGDGTSAAANLAFALLLVTAMFWAHRRLRGIWQATLIIWGMLLGSLVYLLLFPEALHFDGASPLWGNFFRSFPAPLTLDPGVLLSFLFCFFALAVNDLGSIQALETILHPPGMARRITRGMTVTGLANAFSGLLGAVGPVNFSLSPGVIVASGCASRYPLIPAALILMAISWSPLAISLIAAVPATVIGAILLHILVAQVAAGFLAAFTTKGGFLFHHGLIIGFPLLLGTLVAFLPPQLIATLPAVLRPILGNGFVVGVIAALLMEHLISRDLKEPT